MRKLEGKVFLAFGGASGMAKATVKQFAEEGAKIVVADISQEAASAVVEDVKNSGGEAAYVNANVMNENEITAAVQFAVETYGKLDIMLYQPGKNLVRDILDVDTAAWNEVIQLNLTSAFVALRESARKMKESGGGVILMTSSLNSTLPCKRFAAYCSTKAALDMLVRVAALEFGPDIRVCSINPGFMNTPQIAPFTKNKEIMDLVMSTHSTGRIGEPEDFAKLALFLASDDAGYFTGSNIIMDGGGRNFGYPNIIDIHLANKRKLAEAEAKAKAEAEAKAKAEAKVK